MSSKIDSDHGVGAPMATLVKQRSELTTLKSIIAVATFPGWVRKAAKKKVALFQRDVGRRK